MVHGDISLNSNNTLMDREIGTNDNIDISDKTNNVGNVLNFMSLKKLNCKTKDM